jgi:two-component system OmpR family response regulator
MQQQSPGSSMSPRNTGRSDSIRLGSEAEAAEIFAPRIYLVDPDPLTRAQLEEYLRDKGFDVVATHDMEAAPPPVDMLILALDGMELRANRPKWLSAKPGIATIVLDRPRVFPGRAAALGFAPDARLSLPIQPRKLVATIRQVLSLARIDSAESHEASARLYRFAGWTLHRHGRRLESRDGKSIVLTKLEFEVLKTLLTFPRQLLTRQQLIEFAWGPDKQVESRRLDYPITRLRRHLGDDIKFPTLIKTVVGLGYRLDAEVEKSL